MKSVAKYADDLSVSDIGHAVGFTAGKCFYAGILNSVQRGAGTGGRTVVALRGLMSIALDEETTVTVVTYGSAE